MDPETLLVAPRGAEEGRWAAASRATGTRNGAAALARISARALAALLDLRSAANETVGQVVGSSVYLGEDGRPGTVAQVNITA
jgi:hypothetical protein